MENDALQKQWMFTQYPGTKCQWLPLANDLGIDPIQLRIQSFQAQLSIQSEIRFSEYSGINDILMRMKQR